jgi:formate dehydrogenase major subunit
VLRLSIDGRAVDAAEGGSVLDASAVAGVVIPTVCADARLAPSGACRVCVVTIDGQERPVAACTTPARDGMVVETSTPALIALRRTLLELLARDVVADTVASSADEPFSRLFADHGLIGTPNRRSDPSLVDDSHPLIRVDLNRCIKCWRCVRICDEVQGQFTWRIEHRGVDSRIVPDAGNAFADSSCVSCGACVDSCPSGALEDRSMVGAARPTSWTRTTCPYCGVGCQLLVGARDDTIVQITPAHDAPVNRGHLCVKGRYGFGFNASPDRVTQPMIRDGGVWRPVSWSDAADHVAAGFRRIIDRHGPGAIGALGSARATNEDNYLVQRLARAVLGTNNVDCCARVCHAPSAVALHQMFGTGAATSSFDDIERAASILVYGTNTTENHPIVGARIKQAVVHGARLVVIDARRVELAEYADVFLQPRPGTNVLVLNALAAVVIEERLADETFIGERVDGFDDVRSFVRAFLPERIAPECGLQPENLREAARTYATSKPAISFHGLGLTEHQQGTEAVMCLANLALLTGNLGRPGAGVNPLRGQNNVQGAAHMGCEPAHLPGYAPLDDARKRVGATWGATIPDAPGLDVMEMLDAAAAGHLKGLWVVGWDLALTQPNADVTGEALANLDLLVVQDLFLNETARRYGTVFLPAASAFEKDGTFMNSERRIQRVRAAVAPPGDAKPDWEIVVLLAAALGRADLFDYRSPVDIWEEIRQVWTPGAGMTYPRLDAPGGLQWPCPNENHPGTTILHAEHFGGSLGVRASLRAIEYRPAPEQPTDELPLVLVTGRSLYQFNAATMTGRSAIQTLRPTDTLEVNVVDASTFGLTDGALVRVSSRYGEAVLPAEVSGRVPQGTVFATFNDPQVCVNRLTGPHRDLDTNTPDYKVTAVRVEPVRSSSTTPSSCPTA